MSCCCFGPLSLICFVWPMWCLEDGPVSVLVMWMSGFSWIGGLGQHCPRGSPWSQSAGEEALVDQTLALQFMPFLVLSVVLHAASFTHWCYLPAGMCVCMCICIIYLWMMLIWEEALGCWTVIACQFLRLRRIECYLAFTDTYLCTLLSLSS